MSSLVSDFINSVWRQARRLSEISRLTFAGDDERTAGPLPPDDAVSDTGNVEHNAPERHPSNPLPSQSPHLEPLEITPHDNLARQSLESFPEPEFTPRDHLGFPLTPKKGRGIPEDDGMHNLRRRIQAINAREIPSSEKARLMHEAMLKGHSAARSSPRDETYSSGPGAMAGQTWEHTNSAGPLDSLKFWTG